MKSNARMWWVMIALGLTMEGVALFYQYALGDAPCVVCIHIRLWVAGMILAGILGLLIGRSWWFQVPAWLLMIGVSAGFAERAWHTMAVEKGWRFSTCGFDVGLPEWFAVDRWLPWMFAPTGPCGYTPEIALGFTMAEVLVALAGFAVLFSLIGVVRVFLRSPARHFH